MRAPVEAPSVHGGEGECLAFVGEGRRVIRVMATGGRAVSRLCHQVEWPWESLSAVETLVLWQLRRVVVSVMK